MALLRIAHRGALELGCQCGSFLSFPALLNLDVPPIQANATAMQLFILERRVLWHHCLLMMATGAIGGHTLAYGRRLGTRVMRAIVTVLGFAMAGYFFWRNNAL